MEAIETQQNLAFAKERESKKYIFLSRASAKSFKPPRFHSERANVSLHEKQIIHTHTSS